MKKLIVASAILIGGFVSTAANAMPAVSITTTPTSVIQVDYVCGRGYHQTPWGDCRPNWRRPPPPERYYGWHRPPPPPYWGERQWRRHHRYYDGY
ncbi:GCG_CRPN prefix-to-repeats domain-containing protein [Rhizobium sp. HT1-10]|uniref:GCG_CRPN prefix-to-repeats domain-containing protein n=1 Tax=Rhizobium sp. HT1-10 TaxID=3111638 RepID=UPI003C1C96F7